MVERFLELSASALDDIHAVNELTIKATRSLRTVIVVEIPKYIRRLEREMQAALNESIEVARDMINRVLQDVIEGLRRSGTRGNEGHLSYEDMNEIRQEQTRIAQNLDELREEIKVLTTTTSNRDMGTVVDETRRSEERFQRLEGENDALRRRNNVLEGETNELRNGILRMEELIQRIPGLQGIEAETDEREQSVDRYEEDVLSTGSGPTYSARDLRKQWFSFARKDTVEIIDRDEVHRWIPIEHMRDPDMLDLFAPYEVVATGEFVTDDRSVVSLPYASDPAILRREWVEIHGEELPECLTSAIKKKKGKSKARKDVRSEEAESNCPEDVV